MRLYIIYLTLFFAMCKSQPNETVLVKVAVFNESLEKEPVSFSVIIDDNVEISIDSITHVGMENITLKPGIHKVIVKIPIKNIQEESVLKVDTVSTYQLLIKYKHNPPKDVAKDIMINDYKKKNGNLSDSAQLVFKKQFDRANYYQEINPSIEIYFEVYDGRVE